MKINFNNQPNVNPQFGAIIKKKGVDEVLKARLYDKDWPEFNQLVKSQENNPIDIELEVFGQLFTANFRTVGTRAFNPTMEDHARWIFRRPSPMKYFKALVKKADEMNASVQEYNRQRELKIKQCIEANKGVKDEGQ